MFTCPPHSKAYLYNISDIAPSHEPFNHDSMLFTCFQTQKIQMILYGKLYAYT